MDDLLNPILIKALGSLIRAALMLAVPFFVSRGIWTPDEGTATMAAIAAAAAALLLSLFEKYRSQKKLVTALSMPVGSTQKEVEEVIKSEQTPPVSLPKDVAPVRQGTYVGGS